MWDKKKNPNFYFIVQILKCEVKLRASQKRAKDTIGAAVDDNFFHIVNHMQVV